ncbi:MAG: MFS transporter [Actinomycetota bacterium]|nr:MFS transporter [Actinomycetota bacterium]MDQ2955634.1 MFS transporter [Actinomycetota bacterium]
MTTSEQAGAGTPAVEGQDPASDRPVPLSRNRDFRLLWVSQLASVLGSRMSYVAYPLLVLSLTGSPVLAGLIATARAAPQWILGLPAGGLADRWDRRRLMLGCDLIRFLALSCIVVGLLTGLLGYPVVIVIALIEGSATVLFSPAEVGALRHVVPASQLRAATARNESREYGAMLAGPPIGGALYAVASVLPFLGDALSYLVSFVTVSMIRTPFRSAPVDRSGPGSLVTGVRDGLRWVWRQPFLRSSVLMVAGSNLVGNAMPTALVVIAHERGTSAAVIGTVLTLGGLGGLVGSVIAGWAADRVPASWVVVGFPWVWAALLPLLLISHGQVLMMGAVFGLMLAAAPLWNSVLATYRIVLVPDELQGRVDSACRFLTQSVTPLSPPLAGVLLEYTSITITVLAMFGWMLMLGVIGALLPTLRHPPDLPRGDEAAAAQDPAQPVVTATDPLMELE